VIFNEFLNEELSFTIGTNVEFPEIFLKTHDHIIALPEIEFSKIKSEDEVIILSNIAN
jgi:hypothetical protein